MAKVATTSLPINNIPQSVKIRLYSLITAFLLAAPPSPSGMYATRETAAKAEAADISGTGTYIQFPCHLVILLFNLIPLRFDLVPLPFDLVMLRFDLVEPLFGLVPLPFDLVEPPFNLIPL